MASARDNDLVLRASGDGNLTATENDTLTLPGGAPGNKPLAVEFVFPALATGTNPDCTLSIEFVDSDGAIRVTAPTTVDETNTPGVFVLPIPPTDAESFEADYTITGTTPDFGAVEVYVIRGEVKAKVPA